MNSAPDAAWRMLALAAALLGGAGVILAAMGSHAVPLPDAGDLVRWQSASSMHVIHAVAMLAVAAIAQRHTRPALLWGGWLFAVGIVLFCGTLYLRAAGFQLVPLSVAPFGGLCLIAGWLVVAFGCAR